MTEFTPVTGFLGGMLIGLASILALLGSGRIAGISGIVAGLFPPLGSTFKWCLVFIVGMLIGGASWTAISGQDLAVELQASGFVLLAAGFLVGFGTRLGGGCTSGHGVCGIGRLAPRSLVATGVFMVAAFATTFLVRHVFGG